jgi:DHA3 family tetracycline resistance protein-like MFS transporter
VAERNAMVQVLTHREPALLFSGRTVSAFGDGVATVAFTLIVLGLPHGNALSLAIFSAARTVPFIVFLLFGGVIADRMSRRTLILWSDLVRGVITVAVVLLMVTGRLQFWQLVVWAVVFGAFDAVFFPAMTALTPEIVPEELLNAWNALRPMANQVVGAIIGPVVGGLLYSISPTAAIAIDGATFFVSAACVALMHPTPAGERHEDSSMLAEIGEGFSFARRTLWLWATLLIAALGNALIYSPVFALAPFYLRHVLHASATAVGAVVAVGGVSSFVSTAIAGSRTIPQHRMRVTWGAWLVSLMAWGLMSLAFSVPLVALVFVLASPGMVYGNVIWESLMQTEVPRAMLGRVSSVDWLVSVGLTPIGLVLAGVAVAAIGYRPYCAIAALLMLGPTVWAFSSKRMQAVDSGRGAPRSP